MVITTTGIAFSLLSLGLVFCGWRFFKAFLKSSNGDKNKNESGLYLSIFLFASAFQNGILGLGALFLTNNPDGLYSITLLAHQVLVIMAMISTYLAFYILLPKRSAVGAVLLVGLIGVFFLILTIFLHPQPFLTVERGIDWGVSPPLSDLMFILFLISLAPPGYLFFRIFLNAINRELKFVSLAVATLCFSGVINVFTRLVFFRGQDFIIRTQLLDIGVAVIGFGFMIVFLVIPVIKKLISRQR